MTSRLNFFRLGLQLLLGCSDWVSLQTTRSETGRKMQNTTTCWKP